MDIAMNLEHLGNGTIAVTGALKKTVVRSEEDGAFPAYGVRNDKPIKRDSET